jgi:hypothetical protein
MPFNACFVTLEKKIPLERTVAEALAIWNRRNPGTGATHAFVPVGITNLKEISYLAVVQTNAISGIVGVGIVMVR